MSFLFRTLLRAVTQIAALSLLAFALSSVAPGDVLSEAAVDPELRGGASLGVLRAQMHLDEPWGRRYLRWVSGAVRGDFGASLSYGLPVTELILPRLPRTLGVVGPAWVLSWLLGLLLAAATVRLGISRWFDGLAAVLQMIPEVVLASLLTWWLLVYGRVAVDSVWLPLLPVTLGLAPTVFLHAAGSLAAAAQSRPVQLAILANLPPARLGWQYLLPAAANPLLSLLGPTLVAAFGATLLAEAVTGWPGVGTLFLDAFRSRDYPVTQAILLLMGGPLAGINAGTELLLFRLDPRIRYAAE